MGRLTIGVLLGGIKTAFTVRQPRMQKVYTNPKKQLITVHCYGIGHVNTRANLRSDSDFELRRYCFLKSLSVRYSYAWAFGKKALWGAELIEWERLKSPLIFLSIWNRIGWSKQIVEAYYRWWRLCCSVREHQSKEDEMKQLPPCPILTAWADATEQILESLTTNQHLVITKE